MESMEPQVNNERGARRGWFAPAFLLLLLVAFFITPGTTLEKFYMVCFGI